ncbi:MAG: hypothetical protein ACRC2K_06680, partial [Clostridium sp.]
VDSILTKYLIKEFYTLFFEPEPLGGFLDLENYMELLDGFINFIEEISDDEYGLLGIKFALDFLTDDENKQYIIKAYGVDSYDGKYSRVKKLWEVCYNEDRVINSINNNIGVWNWINYYRENPSERILNELEKFYGTENKEFYYLEDLLINYGSQEIKFKIFEDLKKLYNDDVWEKENYSYINVFGELSVKCKDIIPKIKICGVLKNEESKALLVKFLGEFNPEMRYEGIKALFLFNMKDFNDELILEVKNRLCDAPCYVREEALSLCKEKEIFLTLCEYEKIKDILTRVDEDEGFYEELKEIIK